MDRTRRFSTAAFILAGCITIGALGLHDSGSAQEPWNETTLRPVADTYVSLKGAPLATRAAPPQPNGRAKQLSMSFNHLELTRDVAYLRFRMPTPAPETVLALADLALSVTDVSVHPYVGPPPDSGAMRVEAVALTEPWDEASLTGPDVPAQSDSTVHGHLEWGPCPDEPSERCGTVELDLYPLLGRYGMSEKARHGLALRADPTDEDDPFFGWDLLVGSRESDAPPQLHLTYDVVGLVSPADLEGSAMTNCRTGAMDVTMHNVGATAVLADVIIEALGNAPHRFRVPGPIPAGGEVRVEDPEWNIRTTEYLIDPERRLAESNLSNNEIAILILECPPADWTALDISYLPATLQRR